MDDIHDRTDPEREDAEGCDEIYILFMFCLCIFSSDDTNTLATTGIPWMLRTGLNLQRQNWVGNSDHALSLVVY